MSSIFAELNKINDNKSLREERNILGESVDFRKLENYYDAEEFEDKAARYYEKAQEELENYFDCSGAFLEPSVQSGRGYVYLFSDDKQFDGRMDIDESDSYIRNDDFEGFLNLCKNSFTVESPDMSEETNMQKLRKTFPDYAEYEKDHKSKLSNETNMNKIRKAYPDFAEFEKEHKSNSSNISEETNMQKLRKTFPDYAEYEKNNKSKTSTEVNKESLEEAINPNQLVDKIVTVIEKSGFTKRSISSTDSMITMENKDGSKTSYVVKIRQIPEFILEEELSGVVIKTTDKNQFIENSAVTILNG